MSSDQLRFPDGFLWGAATAAYINKRFGAVVALQDVALQIPRGEITGLVGDNGAGEYPPLPSRSSAAC